MLTPEQSKAIDVWRRILADSYMIDRHRVEAIIAKAAHDLADQDEFDAASRETMEVNIAIHDAMNTSAVIQVLIAMNDADAGPAIKALAARSLSTTAIMSPDATDGERRACAAGFAAGVAFAMGQPRSSGGRATHDANYADAKAWVVAEWDRDGATGHSGNKSEFARLMVPRVKQRFNNSRGDPLDITARTIAADWLSHVRGKAGRKPKY